jgi:hypothetical protein
MVNQLFQESIYRSIPFATYRLQLCRHNGITSTFLESTGSVLFSSRRRGRGCRCGIPKAEL